MDAVPADFAGRRVTVMGLGRFGGGVGVARFLARRGADVLVTDTAGPEELAASVARLDGQSGVAMRLGGHNVSDFTDTDLVVVNPAVKPGNRFVRAARAAGVELTSEIRLLVRHLPSRERVIGVTGSAGKSTVTAMIGHVLGGKWPGGRVAGWPSKDVSGRRRVWVGGNIGGSLLECLDRIAPDDWVVLELSSFMLEGLREDRWSPHIAVVTNLSPNHLDWHGGFAAYAEAKRTLTCFQTVSDVQLVGDESAAALTDPARQRLGPVAEADVPALAVPGAHNRRNARLAAAVLRTALGSDTDLSPLSAFPGLPHRLQFVGEHAGVRYYNDSKSTTPEAATLAIDAFSERTVRIILGGSDKGSDLTGLARHAAARCVGVYTIGTTGVAIADAAEAYAPPAGRPGSCGAVAWPPPTAAVRRCGTLDAAMAAIAAEAKPGENVVLSPACASWDQFANYEARGDAFAAALPPTSRIDSVPGSFPPTD